jgi:hypothetical protein
MLKFTGYSTIKYVKITDYLTIKMSTSHLAGTISRILVCSKSFENHFYLSCFKTVVHILKQNGYTIFLKNAYFSAHPVLTG